jgi:hypothetical protein
METGDLVVNPKKGIAKVHTEIVRAISEVREGKFIPDRENDELTRALGNPEKPGRTRGFGPSVPWKSGFPEHIDTYRSRDRGKKRKEKEEEDRISGIQKQCNELYSLVQMQQQQLNEMRNQGGSSH